jgi:hypothetical protein
MRLRGRLGGERTSAFEAALVGPSIDEIIAAIRTRRAGRRLPLGGANPYLAGFAFAVGLVVSWTPIALLAIWLL